MMGIECLLLIPFTLNYKLLDKAGRWAYYYLVSSVIYAVGSIILAKIFHSNLWFSNIMQLAQFFILSFYYYLVIKNNLVKQIIKIVAGLALIIFLLDFFKLEGIHSANSIFATIRTMVFLIYGIIFFLQLLSDENLVKEAVFINSLPDFWFNSGLFIYLCSSFFYALASNFLIRNNIATDAPIQTVIFLGGIIEGILFYIGLMKAQKLRHEFF